MAIRSLQYICISNVKLLKFTDKRQYVIKPDTYCTPKKKMSSTNLDDAKKECIIHPSCDMFYDRKGAGSSFRACENTASIRNSTIGAILYHLSGNITHT